jgi:hypothetical protein
MSSLSGKVAIVIGGAIFGGVITTLGYYFWHQPIFSKYNPSKKDKCRETKVTIFRLTIECSKKEKDEKYVTKDDTIPDILTDFSKFISRHPKKLSFTAPDKQNYDKFVDAMKSHYKTEILEIADNFQFHGLLMCVCFRWEGATTDIFYIVPK